MHMPKLITVLLVTSLATLQRVAVMYGIFVSSHHQAVVHNVDISQANFTFMLLCIVMNLYLNNQPDALIIQIYSAIKLYMFLASSLPIIRIFPLYIRHW